MLLFFQLSISSCYSALVRLRDEETLGLEVRDAVIPRQNDPMQSHNIICHNIELNLIKVKLNFLKSLVCRN